MLSNAATPCSTKRYTFWFYLLVLKIHRCDKYHSNQAFLSFALDSGRCHLSANQIFIKKMIIANKKIETIETLYYGKAAYHANSISLHGYQGEKKA